MDAKALVFDSYIKKSDGTTVHFDIIVPDGTSEEVVLGYGKEYLSTIGITSGYPTKSRCQFCHVEEATEEMAESFAKQGYHIVRFEDIPPELPSDPTRRQLILYIRAHSDKLRFADFSRHSHEQLVEIARELE